MSIPTLAQEMVLESIKIEGLKPGAIIFKKNWNHDETEISRSGKVNADQ